jgi:hypothetical protein
MCREWRPIGSVVGAESFPAESFPRPAEACSEICRSFDTIYRGRLRPDSRVQQDSRLANRIESAPRVASALQGKNLIFTLKY